MHYRQANKRPCVSHSNRCQMQAKSHAQTVDTTFQIGPVNQIERHKQPKLVTASKPPVSFDYSMTYEVLEVGDITKRDFCLVY